MPIKTPAGGVTGEDFTAALEALRVSVAEVAKATGIPRTYLSDLRNHGTPLRREYAAKLRDWLIGEGIEFDESAPPAAAGGKAASKAIHFPRPAFRMSADMLCEDMSPDAQAANMSRLDEIVREVAKLLSAKVAPPAGFILSDKDDDGLNDEERDKVGKVRDLLAEEAIIRRRLEGRCILPASSEDGKPKTIADALADKFRNLTAAEFIEPSAADGDESDEGADDLEGMPSQNAKGATAAARW